MVLAGTCLKGFLNRAADDMKRIVVMKLLDIIKGLFVFIFSDLKDFIIWGIVAVGLILLTMKAFSTGSWMVLAAGIILSIGVIVLVFRSARGGRSAKENQRISIRSFIAFVSICLVLFFLDRIFN
ncbi:MAG: hypothetical protein JXR23_02355 [Pontiellaceae bacterium]|nr:hypothetical protein [Pontiellaceae bacterium]